MTYTRTPIPLPELQADIDVQGRTAARIHSELTALLDSRLVPSRALPSLHASRKAAESLVMHLDAALALLEEASRPPVGGQGLNREIG